MTAHDGTDCPMARAVGMLGDRWTLLLVREAMDGASRYDEFKTRLGMSDNTLSRRLRELIDTGLLERTRAGARTAYRLTAAGEDLASVLAVLGSWNQRWFPVRRPRQPPHQVRDAAESLGLTLR